MNAMRRARLRCHDCPAAAVFGVRCERCRAKHAEKQRRREAAKRRQRVSLIEADIQFVRDLVQHAGYTGEQFVTVGRDRLLSVLAHVESLENARRWRP
jgi:hypothetical protein